MSEEGSMVEESAESFYRSIMLRRVDGSTVSADIEGVEDDSTVESVARLTLRFSDRVVEASSERGFFDALRIVRVTLEKEGILLCCFGGGENVYPSPMQESMGFARLAYRNELGRQASSSDIVDIFDTDDSVRPATVEQQEDFHKRWLSSL